MKILIIVIASMLITSFGAFKVHEWRVAALKVDWAVDTKKQLDNQRTSLTKACNDVIDITRKASDEYQEKISDLNSELTSARRMFKHSCIAVTGQSARRSDGSASTGEPADARNSGNPSIEGSELVELFGEGEHYRLQVIGLQSYISKKEASQACY